MRRRASCLTALALVLTSALARPAFAQLRTDLAPSPRGGSHHDAATPPDRPPHLHGGPHHGGPPPPPPHSDGGPRHSGPPPVEVLGEQAERLGLDEKTRDAVRAVIKDSRTEADRLRDEIGDAREAMREMLSRPDIDEPTVMQQADTIGALELEEYKNWLRAMMRIRGLLTPEQRTVLIRMRKELFAEVFAGSREACKGDIERLCSGRQGDEEARACMRRHRDDVSVTCRNAIAAEFAKKRKQF